MTFALAASTAIASASAASIASTAAAMTVSMTVSASTPIAAVAVAGNDAAQPGINTRIRNVDLTCQSLHRHDSAECNHHCEQYVFDEVFAGFIVAEPVECEHNFSLEEQQL